jgi:hypothetical protein
MVCRRDVQLPQEESTFCFSPTADDVWIVRTKERWTIAYHLVLQAGSLVVGELRVYPIGVDGHGAPWERRDRQQLEAATPTGGLSATFVHNITVGRDVDLRRRRQLFVRGLRGPQATQYRRLLASIVPSNTARRPTTTHRRGGPPGKGIRFYQAVRRVYLQAPDRPVQAVAEALKISPQEARDAVYRARNHYHLIPPTSRGKAHVGLLLVTLGEKFRVSDDISVTRTRQRRRL